MWDGVMQRQGNTACWCHFCDTAGLFPGLAGTSASMYSTSRGSHLALHSWESLHMHTACESHDNHT